MFRFCRLELTRHCIRIACNLFKRVLFTNSIKMPHETEKLFNPNIDSMLCRISTPLNMSQPLICPPQQPRRKKEIYRRNRLSVEIPFSRCCCTLGGGNINHFSPLARQAKFSQERSLFMNSQSPSTLMAFTSTVCPLSTGSHKTKESRF